MSMRASVSVHAALIAALGFAANLAGADCVFGSPGAEATLQSTFNTLLGANPPYPVGAPNVVTACVNDGADAAWRTTGSVGAATIVLELAGNRNSNTFGVYDLADPDRRITVFEGNDGVAADATIRLRQEGDGTWTVSVWELNNTGDTASWTHLRGLDTGAFGFYLGTQSNGTFFSNTGLNWDGRDHLFAYQGNGATFLSGPLQGSIFRPDDFILAWEDLAGGGDRDYQDFVAIVQDITPVPLPTAVWLLGSGLIALAGVARRRA